MGRFSTLFGRSIFALSFLGVLAISPGTASAQVLYGSIVGQVDDQSGATIPGAKVTATEQATGLIRETTADDGGRYTFQSIPSGNYSLKIVANGFRAMTQAQVQVTVNAVTRVDVKLELGSVSDTVTVEGSVATLQTDKSDTRSSIDQKVIETLPLNQYRNYQALINLVPGASPAATQNSSTDTPQRALRSFVNGTATNNNSTRLDGAINVNIWLPHHVAYVAPSETVEEVNIVTSSFDAEQGMAGGAAITVVSKSGTNDLHGAAWEYHENQKLRSEPYFRQQGFVKPRYTLNIFGGRLGGAIIKNKLFYFGHYEGTRTGNGATSTFSLPNDAIKAGDFSAYSSAIYDPLSGNPDGTGRVQFAGNKIPSNRISPVTQKILPMIPSPNSPTASSLNNSFISGVGKLDRDNYDTKVNWNRNDRQTIFGKFSMVKGLAGGVAGLGQLVGNGVGGDPALGDTKQYLVTVGTNYTIRPNLLLDAIFGYTRLDQTATSVDFGKNWGTDVFGIPGTNGTDPLYSGLPAFTFGANTAVNNGLWSGYGQMGTWIPMQRNDRSYTFTTNLSWLKGKHEFRFGFDMIHHQLNHWQPEVANPRGAFDFSGNVTALKGGAAATNYNQFADFLLGYPTAITKSIQNVLMTGREWQFGFYARDRYQVTRNLTVNLGLRVERYPLMSRADSGIERLDYTTMKIYLGGRGNVPQDAGISVKPLFFVPRVGIAYRLGERTVIRAGYGMTIDPLPFSRPLRGWYPLTVTGNFVSPKDSFDPFRTLSDGIPAVVGPDMSSGIVDLPATVDMRSPYSKINRGYIQSWNFTIENRLPGKFITSIGYVGTQTTNQLADRDLNAGIPGLGNSGRPFASQFNRRINTNLWDGWLSSNYHGLQTSINRQFSNGLLIKGAYTYSKAINMTDEDGWATVNFNWEPVINRNRAPAGYDRTNNFQIAFVYALPLGKGKAYAQSGFASAILGGWQINGNYYAYSGTPFNITAADGQLAAPNNVQTADQIKSDVQYLGGKGPGQPYIDPTAFAAPTGPRFGTTGRNRFRGPGVAGLDASLFRHFKFTERVGLDFRAESFNLTNTPRFANPGANVSNPGSFMMINSTTTTMQAERQFRFGVKLAF